ncbi:ATP-binding protein [Burkholderia sola]|uniref:ATP-binding protein n=1 Tax=Burkholderia sola TaxID=2843302 RepID=UPI0023DDC5AD|nr:ATP-binding protein [Burkholderia sola]MDF3079886.1 response regulator [Burkholderia sola]
MSQSRGNAEEASGGADDGIVTATQAHAPLRLTFSKRLLIVSTITLTCLILVCAGGVTELLISHQHEEFAQQFSAQREALKEEVDRREARIRQLVVTYQIAKEYLESGDSQARKVLLPKKNQLAQTVPGSAATRAFSVVSTLTSPSDAARQTNLIDLARYASTFSLSHQDNSPALSEGFIYTPDKRFLATLPPLAPDQIARLNTEKAAEDFIGKRMEAVEEEMQRDAQSGVRGKVVWVTGLKDPLNDMTTTYFATSVYDGEQRKATIALSIPCNRFNQYFLHNEGDPHFFVVSCAVQRLLGIDETNPQEAHWAEIISRNPWVYKAANGRPQRIWREGSFFVIQRVPGPQWVAVYAYTWSDLLGAIRQQLLLVVLATLSGCGLVIGGAFWMNREVIRPSRERLHSLLEGEAFSRSIIQVAPVSLTVVARRSGAILLQNAEAQSLQMAFASQGEKDSSPDNVLARAGALVRFHAGSAERSGVVSRFEMEPDLEVAYAQAKYRGDDVFVIGMVDLAKRKEIERRLRESRARAQAESHEKGMFLATMSHEIRTPLHGALGNLELLSRMGLTQEQRSRLLIAQDSFGSLLSLINGVLDLSRIEAGEFLLQEQPQHIDQLVEQASRTFAVDAQKNGVRLLCLIDPALRGTWICDGYRFTQIVTNLIGNAVKFTSHGAITVSLGLTGDGQVRLRVADSGRGIPEDEIEKIFMPYVQGSAGPKSSRAGTGLGLSLCQKIAERMGGSITVESEVGVGSIFTVVLPLRHDSAAQINGNAGQGVHFVVNCDIPSWRGQLAAQLSAWYPAARVTSGQDDVREEAHASTVFIDARDWLEHDGSSETTGAYRRITIGLDGPLVPISTGHAVTISAYSGQLLLDAIEMVLSGADDNGREGTDGSGEITGGAWSDASVLVVEDDRVSAQLMCDQLRMLGIGHVEVVGSAEDGIRRCQSRIYDLVVTDSNLPGKGGAELLSDLRAAGILWPVVLCTADATLASVANTRFDALITKPSTLGDLSLVLQNVLGPGDVQQPTVATPDVSQLLSLFIESWISDKEALRLMVQAGHVSEVLERLHRIQGALMILDRGELVSHLEEWSAKIAESKCVEEADCQSFVDAVESWLALHATAKKGS